MKDIKEQFIIYKHSEGMTIYDVCNDVFYELNSSATIVFENIDLDEDQLVNLFKLTYEENASYNFLQDIIDIKKALVKFFE